MKLYHFFPNHWYKNIDYPVLANSKEDALQLLINYLAKKAHESSHWTQQYEQWKNSTIEHLPESYILKERDIISQA